MRIINIVDRLDRVNFGIWNAAIATAAELKGQFGVESEVWFPASTNEAKWEELNGVLPRGLKRLDQSGLEAIMGQAALDPARDIIVSHGCWQYPTRWGKELKRKGFAWMAVPHGMLEPWSVSQKRLQKWIYFHFKEKHALKLADTIRAVGRPEFDNLKPLFGNQLVWIANGVTSTESMDSQVEPSERKDYLFMARLHHKKGLMELVEGWKMSSQARVDSGTLRIAGPDDGELGALETFLKANPKIGSIEYVGPVYGAAKMEFLKKCQFYVLPSYSEGFPTSVLEAMQHGLVPLISNGCNFPDVFEHDLGIQMEPNILSVREGLDLAQRLSPEKLQEKSAACRKYINENYTHTSLAVQQFRTFKGMLAGNSVKAS